ncbi:MAG: DUF4125 family protein [Oscillospiraceae bacterium]|jgi:hypothetical protein|nr:DUF4125 family protein [Oscillospiraceae bacterium]
MDKALTDNIVALEWDMFQLVNEGGPRADCQDDFRTFDGMRRGQFEAWSDEAAKSYEGDLEAAKVAGRNLIAEKYIHMMRTTTPARYEKLMEGVPRPTERAEALAQAISDKMLAQTEALQEKYPYVSGTGRPLHSASDFSGVTSIETYQLGELLTYSENTLAALGRHLDALEANGVSLAGEILANSVKFYGYASLKEAEDAARTRAEASPLEVLDWSFGCADCD